MAETRALRVVFVCWGNICRSPMAERVAEYHAAEAGVSHVVFSSAAVSSEEIGAPIDRRATQILRDHGYRTGDHAARRIDTEQLADADLVIAMEQIHISRLRDLGVSTEHVKLLSDFDPAAEPGSGVPDPWYGSDDGFGDTLAMIESAMPSLIRELTNLRT